MSLNFYKSAVQSAYPFLKYREECIGCFVYVEFMSDFLLSKMYLNFTDFYSSKGHAVTSTDKHSEEAPVRLMVVSCSGRPYYLPY